MGSGSWAFKGTRQSQMVPGSSRWTSNHLYDMSRLMLDSVEGFYRNYEKEIHGIDRLMNHIADEEAIAAYIEQCSSELDQITKLVYSSPRKQVGSEHKTSISPQKIQPQTNQKHLPLKEFVQRLSLKEVEKVFPPSSPGNKILEITEEYDKSLQRIHKSIYKKTSEMANLNSIKEESRPTKTPSKSPFVSLPPREPLNINSSLSHISRKSISRKNTKSSKDFDVKDFQVKEFDSNSPIRRRYPSFIEPNDPTTKPKALPDKSPVRREFNREFIQLNRESLNRRPYKVANGPSPVRRLLAPSKTPSKQIIGAISTASSTDSTKLISRSPTRFGAQYTKNSSFASTKDDTEPLINEKPSVPMISASTPARFMSPTHSSIAKNTIKKDLSKNKFLTMTLDLSMTLSKLPIKQNHVSPDKSLQTSIDVEGFQRSKSSSDASAIPPLKEKSFLFPRNQLEPKKTTVPLHQKRTLPQDKSLSSNNAVKYKLEASTTVEYKRRRLGGNAIALPDAARPPHLRQNTPGANINLTPNTHVSKSVLSIRRNNTGNSKVQAKTPMRIDPPEFKIHIDSKIDLPEIDTDDETSSRRVLKPWAASPELYKLILENKQIDPKTVFGEVPVFHIEDVFESEASRLRGKSSPMKNYRDMKRAREMKSLHN